MNSKWVCVFSLGLAVFLCEVCSGLAEGSQDDAVKMTLGGVSDSKGFGNSAEIDSLARFAVEEHNKKENGFLEFSRVLKAKEQVVSGKLYHLTSEATDAGKKKIYEAKVWVKPWLRFKQLQEFRLVKGMASCAPSYIGAKLGMHGPGWKTRPIHDPDVQEAAMSAVSCIQQRSNSLLPYELLEIVLAKTKVSALAPVIENYVKYDLLLKMSRGSRVEKFRVEVCKDGKGNFI